VFQASEFSLRPVHQVRTPQRKHRSQSTHRGTGICSSAWTSENCGVICRGKRANGTYIYKVGSQSGIIKLVQISARKIGTYGGHTSLSLSLSWIYNQLKSEGHHLALYGNCTRNDQTTCQKSCHGQGRVKLHTHPTTEFIRFGMLGHRLQGELMRTKIVWSPQRDASTPLATQLCRCVSIYLST
jgi:hypothetical protein